MSSFPARSFAGGFSRNVIFAFMFMTRPFLQSLSPAPRFIIRAQVFLRCTDFRELTPFSARPIRGKQGCFIYLLIYSFCPSSRQIWHHREPRHTRRHAHISYPLFPDHNEVVSLILSLFYPQNQHTHTYAYTHGHPQRSVCKLHHRPSSLELYRAACLGKDAPGNSFPCK